MTTARRPDGRFVDPAHPIRVAARLTGLSVDTLRAWERRYAAVRPTRGARGRVYTDGDVARLRALGDLVRRGHAIGTVANLDEAHLRRLLESSTPTVLADQSPRVPLANLQAITAALDRYDLDEIERAMTTFAVLLPPHDLVFTVVLPLLREVGDRWARGNLRPSQEHFISAIVRSVLGGLLRTTARPHAHPQVIFAAPAGERHELGLLCAAVLATAAGIGVVYLGPDLPAADVAHAAAATNASVVVLALTARGVVPQAERRALARLSAERPVWAGGPEGKTLAQLENSRVRAIDHLEFFVERLRNNVR